MWPSPDRWPHLTLQWLPAERLEIHAADHEPLDADKVSFLAVAFDPAAVGALCVRREAGRYRVTNGRHRLLALRQVAPAGTLVPCLVLESC